MNHLKKVGIVLGAVVLALGLFFLGKHLSPKELRFGVVSTFSTTTDSYFNQASDVWGTHIGTSTVGAGFPSANATSTVVSKIGRDKNQATYQVKIVSVTSTANHLDISVQGSNDYLCDTSAGSASSTTDVITSNINWFDAMEHLNSRVHTSNFTSGSSSLVANFLNSTAGDAYEINLNDLNFQCLRLSISGSSTVPYVGLSAK